MLGRAFQSERTLKDKLLSWKNIENSDNKKQLTLLSSCYKPGTILSIFACNPHNSIGSTVLTYQGWIQGMEKGSNLQLLERGRAEIYTWTSALLTMVPPILSLWITWTAQKRVARGLLQMPGHVGQWFSTKGRFVPQGTFGSVEIFLPVTRGVGGETNGYTPGICR